MSKVDEYLETVLEVLRNRDKPMSLERLCEFMSITRDRNGRWSKTAYAKYDLVGRALQKLKRSGEVELVKGRGGGWKLARSAESTRADKIEASRDEWRERYGRDVALLRGTVSELAERLARYEKIDDPEDTDADYASALALGDCLNKWQHDVRLVGNLTVAELGGVVRLALIERKYLTREQEKVDAVVGLLQQHELNTIAAVREKVAELRAEYERVPNTNTGLYVGVLMRVQMLLDEGAWKIDDQPRAD